MQLGVVVDVVRLIREVLPMKMSEVHLPLLVVDRTESDDTRRSGTPHQVWRKKVQG